MKITEIETFTVGAGWKNWLFVKVHTDAGIHGVGEGTLNGFIATTEAGVHELKHLAIGQDPRRINALAKRMLDSVSLDGGHIHRTVDRGGRGRLLGHSRQVARRADPPAARRPRARQRARLRQRLVSHRAHAGGLPRGGARGAREGLQGVQARSRSAPRRASSRARSSSSPTTSAARCATSCRRDTLILIDVHARFTEIAALQAARAASPTSTSTGGRSRPSRDRQETVHEVAHRSPDPGGDRRDVRHGRPVLHAGRAAAASTSSSPSRCRSAASRNTHAGGQPRARAWQLHRAAPERRAGGDGRLPAARRRACRTS